MKYLRGDLSAPVLAILVTVGIIAAGLILLAWFWWFAPQAGRAGTLQILGTPAIDSEGTLYISVKNVGSDNVTIEAVYVGGKPCNLTENQPSKLPPGESESLVYKCEKPPTGAKTVDGVIMTNYGTYAFTAVVIG